MGSKVLEAGNYSVFEVVGSMYFLSEVWLPGKGGPLVGKMDNSQERKSVKGPKAK